MSQLNLQRMRIELLGGGVSPKFVRRSLMELNTHFQDLKEQAMNDGYSERESEEKAGSAIGDENTLVREILAKKELKTWSWRYPKTLYIAGPTITLILCYALFLFCLMTIDKTFPSAFVSDQGVEIPAAVKILVESLAVITLRLLTPLLAIFTILLAKSRMISMLWAVIGVVILTLVGSGWAYTIDWPTADLIGRVQFQWGYSFLPRFVAGNHDVQNYMRIITTFALCALVWRAYRPISSGSRNDNFQGSSG